MRILLAGGGTGGHIMPILAVVKQIKHLKKDVDFLFVGTEKGPEAKLVKEAGIKFKSVLAGKMRRYLSFKNIIDFFKAPIGIRQARIIVDEFKPDVLFSKGGYVSVPTVLACYKLGVPIILHESDVRPGRANLFMAKYADKIALGFEQAKTYFGEFADKCVVTGNPVRAEILDGSTKRGYVKFGLEYDKPVLLVMGGSQGAKRVNELVGEVLPCLLAKWQVVHLTGDLRTEEQKNLRTDKFKDYHFFKFLDAQEMGDVLACADLVVSRAGANSLAEIAGLGRPSILIPYPYAVGDHQKLNAEVFEKVGASVVLNEDGLTGEKLLEKVKEVDLERMGMRALGLAKADVGKVLAEEILKFGK